MSSSGDQVLLDQQTVMSQNITLFDRYGNHFSTQLDVINYLLNFTVVEGIIYGSQVGACFILLLVLLLLSKAEKRKSPVFIFNTLSLLFNLIYAVLQCCYYTSTWLSAYSFLSYDFSFVTPAAKRSTVAAVVFVILTSICIEVSLVLQVHVVSITLIQWQKLGVMVVSTFVALVAIGFRIAKSIITLECNLGQEDFCNKWTWMDKAKDITLTISICFFSAIFCAKLGLSLRQRRKLGMKQFGSMQIIFIGGFQTMIIPAIFSILQFVSNSRLPQIGSNVLTVTAISLPLTSLWASSSAASPNKAARGPNAHRKFLVDSSTSDSTRKASVGSPWPARTTATNRVGMLASVSTTGGEADEDKTWGKYSPGLRHGVGPRDVERDLEMQELKERE